MQAVAAIAVCALIGASLVVAVRLLLLHRRSGGWPELMLGGMLLLSVGVGYPANIAAAAAPVGPAWSGLFLALGTLATSGGFSLLLLFTWRVFRPQAAWARVLVAGGVLALAGAALEGCIRAVRDGHMDVAEMSLGQILLHTGTAMAAYTWTAWESLGYFRTMRRRVELGLADPVVANRFLVWGLMGICATCGIAFNVGAAMLGVDGLNSPGVLFGSGCIGMAQAVFLTLAFVPPRSYLGWIRARAATSRD